MSRNVFGFEKDTPAARQDRQHASEAATTRRLGYNPPFIPNPAGDAPATQSAAEYAARRVTVPEDTALRYARQTRNAVVTLASIAMVTVILSLVLGIVMAVGIHKLSTGGVTSTSSSCASVGGTDLSC